MAGEEDIPTLMLELARTPVDNQVDVFLKAHLADFVGAFDNVYAFRDAYNATAHKFANDTATGSAGVDGLSMMHAAKFLDEQKKTMTAINLRTALKRLHLDSGGAPTVPLIALLMIYYNMEDAEDLFIIDPESLHPDVRKLWEAEQATIRLNEELAAQDEEMAELRAIAKQGGVAGGRAKLKLTTMEREAYSQRGKLIAENDKNRRASENYFRKNDPLKEELERVASQQSADKQDRLAKRRESVENMTVFNPNTAPDGALLGLK